MDETRPAITRHALGLGVLLLTFVPVYLMSRPDPSPGARVVVWTAPDGGDSAETATSDFTCARPERNGNV